MLYSKLDIKVSRKMKHLLKFNTFADAPKSNEIFTQDEFDVHKTSLVTSVNIFKI